MLQDIAPHIYHNEMSWQPPKADDHVLELADRAMTVESRDGRIILPTVADCSADAELQYLFSVDERAYFWLKKGKLTDARFCAMPLFKLREQYPDEQLFACAVAQSLIGWYRSNRFCGRCGEKMQPSTAERAMVCPSCANTVYPKICPAVIVAIHDKNRLVLTKYKDRPFKKYALVAGFAEIGEPIEQTVHREVMEETGLRVKNLLFYKSQPWVFTDTLLMGFYAELDGSDEIRVQEDELSEANWFSRDEIPEDHSHISLTGEMIEKFRSGTIIFPEDAVE